MYESNVLFYPTSFFDETRDENGRKVIYSSADSIRYLFRNPTDKWNPNTGPAIRTAHYSRNFSSSLRDWLNIRSLLRNKDIVRNEYVEDESRSNSSRECQYLLLENLFIGMGEVVPALNNYLLSLMNKK